MQLAAQIRWIDIQINKINTTNLGRQTAACIIKDNMQHDYFMNHAISSQKKNR